MGEAQSVPRLTSFPRLIHRQDPCDPPPCSPYPPISDRQDARDGSSGALPQARGQDARVLAVGRTELGLSHPSCDDRAGGGGQGRKRPRGKEGSRIKTSTGSPILHVMTVQVGGIRKGKRKTDTQKPNQARGAKTEGGCGKEGTGLGGMGPKGRPFTGEGRNGNAVTGCMHVRSGLLALVFVSCLDSVRSADAIAEPHQTRTHTPYAKPGLFLPPSRPTLTSAAPP
jgi:hypothetical protein